MQDIGQQQPEADPSKTGPDHAAVPASQDPGTAPRETARNRSRRARVALAATAAALGLAALTVGANLRHEQASHADQRARTDAARSCLAAIVTGERALASGSQALADAAARAGAARSVSELGLVHAAAAAVNATQRPALAALIGCSADRHAPQPCSLAANLLRQAADRQSDEAARVEATAAAAVAGRPVTALLAGLAAQEQGLTAVVRAVPAGDCQHATAVAGAARS